MAQHLDTYRRRGRDEPFLDVWSRTAPHYRRRSAALLLVTAALFAGLCCFAYWLRTGAFAPWLSAQYWALMWQSVNPRGPDQVTLVDFLLFPISVEQVPIQMVIMGLLLASLASIPILVGILYRFPFAMIFVAMIALLAAMPWFGLTILAGCILSSHRMFRLRFRYASAALGLVPIVIYFLMATREPESAYAAATPMRFKLYAPWVLAVLGSCVICAVALGIAWLINYRPGGIAPVLAVLFAVPVLLFHSEVGRDELEYRLIEHRFGPNSTTAFINVNLYRAEAEEAERAWKAARRATFDAIFRNRIGRRAWRAFEDLARDRAEAVAACDEFMEYFPDSRHVPGVLFIKGRALDQRISRRALESEVRISHYADVPSEQSRSIWQTLAARFPDSPPAAVALNRLAVLELRAGRIAEAAAALDALLRKFDPAVTATQPGAGSRPRPGLFAKAPAGSNLGIDAAVEVQRARRLRELIALCESEPPRPFDPLAPDAGLLSGPPVHPLTALVSLDERHPAYTDHLIAMSAAFRGSAIEPMIAAQLALLEATPTRRIERLAEAVAKFAGQPGCAELLLRQGEALKEAARFVEAAQVFDRLADEFPNSCWTAESRERMTSLTMLGLAG